MSPSRDGGATVPPTGDDTATAYNAWALFIYFFHRDPLLKSRQAGRIYLPARCHVWKKYRPCWNPLPLPLLPL